MWQRKETRSLEKLVELAIESIWSYQQAKRKDKTNLPMAEPHCKWMSAPPGTMKINSDAVIFEKENAIRLGVIIRER